MTTVLASILALFSTCAVASPAENNPDEVQPPQQTEEETQHFCCFSVSKGTDGKGEGDGCATIGAGNIDGCAKVLACPAGWLKDEGHVSCL